MIFKKAKGPYLYSSDNVKYFDLSNNGNIAGYSNKKIIHKIKNNISSSFNICRNTVYHKRTIKLFNSLYSDNYTVCVSFTPEDFFLRLSNYAADKKYSLNLYGKSIGSGIDVIDAAQVYLHEKRVNGIINGKNKDKINILNYYWFPEIPDSICNADIAVMPAFLSGGFEFIIILINKESDLFTDRNLFVYELLRMPSLYLSACINQFYLIQSIDKSNVPVVKSDDILQNGRIFLYKDKEKLLQNEKLFFDKKVILNYNMPYYNYFPLILDQNQIRQITGIFNA